MTSSWLLLLPLLLLVVIILSVNSQSTTDDEDTCGGGGQLLSKLQRDVDRILDNQQRLFELLQQRQTPVSDCPRLGKYHSKYM